MYIMSSKTTIKTAILFINHEMWDQNQQVLLKIVLYWSVEVEIGKEQFQKLINWLKKCSVLTVRHETGSVMFWSCFGGTLEAGVIKIKAILKKRTLNPI